MSSAIATASAKHNRNKMSSSYEKKRFCGVCKNAGLSEREYTSHYTKSTPGPKGIVICPTILNNVCSFCKCQGHFRSNCSEMKKMNRSNREQEVLAKRAFYESEKEKTAKTVKKQSNNRFALLEEDENVSDMLTTIVQVNPSKTFASIAAKGAMTSGTLEMPKMETIENLSGFTVMTKEGQTHIEGKAYERKQESIKTSWYDCESSDEEDDVFDFDEDEY